LSPFYGKKSTNPFDLKTTRSIFTDNPSTILEKLLAPVSNNRVLDIRYYFQYDYFFRVKALYLPLELKDGYPLDRLYLHGRCQVGVWWREHLFLREKAEWSTVTKVIIVKVKLDSRDGGM
jgi:hypothetical protein